MTYGERKAIGSVQKPQLWALGFVLAAVALVVHLWPESDTPRVDSTQPAAEPHGAVVAAAAARIATESRSPTTAAPAVRAAPVPGPEHPAVATGGSALALPEGYTLVSANGEMAKAFVGVRDQRSQSDDGLEWLGAPEAVETLAALAADNGRGWSFGWIRLAADAREADLAPSLETAGARIVGSAGRLLRVRLPGDQDSLGRL